MRMDWKRRLGATGLTLVMLAPGVTAAQEMTGDPANGESLFGRCMSCHQIGPDAENRPTGPNLNGVVGRTAGSNEGFEYSGAMSESGHVWDEETLMAFLESPQQFVPGTRMAFPGLRDEQDRADIIAYLAQFDEEGNRVEE